MIEFMLDFHSGWRYLVILAVIIAFGFFAYALATRQTKARQEKVVAILFSIVVDTQILLGIILFVLFIFDDARELRREHFEHLVVGLLLLPIVHAYSFMARRDAPQQRLRLIGLLAPILTMILVFAGIASLGLGLFEMTG